jgi:hypothetical protein
VLSSQGFFYLQVACKKPVAPNLFDRRRRLPTHGDRILRERRTHVCLALTSTPVCYLREYPARGRSSFAMIPVQPVWWEAPTPLPLSPSKYSWKGM